MYRHNNSCKSDPCQGIHKKTPWPGVAFYTNAASIFPSAEWAIERGQQLCLLAMDSYFGDV